MMPIRTFIETLWKDTKRKKDLSTFRVMEIHLLNFQPTFTFFDEVYLGNAAEKFVIYH